MLIMNTFLLLICSELVTSLPHTLPTIDIVNITEAYDRNNAQSSLIVVNETLPKKDSLENVLGGSKKKPRHYHKDIENHIADEKGTRISVEDDKRRQRDNWKDMNDRDEKATRVSVEDDKLKHGKWRTELNYHEMVPQLLHRLASYEIHTNPAFRKKRKDDYEIGHVELVRHAHDFMKTASKEDSNRPQNEFTDMNDRIEGHVEALHHAHDYMKQASKEDRNFEIDNNINNKMDGHVEVLRHTQDYMKRTSKEDRNFANRNNNMDDHIEPLLHAQDYKNFEKNDHVEPLRHALDYMKKASKEDRKPPLELLQRHIDGHKHRIITSTDSENLNNGNRDRTPDNNPETNSLNHEPVGGDRYTFKDDIQPRNDGNELIEMNGGIQGHEELLRHAHDYMKKASQADRNFENDKKINKIEDHEEDQTRRRDTKENDRKPPLELLQRQTDSHKHRKNTSRENENRANTPDNNLETNMFHHESVGDDRNTIKYDIRPQKQLMEMNDGIEGHAELLRHDHDYMKKDSQEDKNFENIKNRNNKKDHMIDPMSRHEQVHENDPNILEDDENLLNIIEKLDLHDLNIINQHGNRTLGEGVDFLDMYMAFLHEQADAQERKGSKEENPQNYIKTMRHEQHLEELPERHKDDYDLMNDTLKEEENLRNNNKETVPENLHSKDGYEHNMKDTLKEEENMSNINKQTVPQNLHSHEKINEEKKTFREHLIHRHKKWDENEKKHDTDVVKIIISSSENRKHQKASRRNEDQNNKKLERKSMTSFEDEKKRHQDSWARENKNHAAETDKRNIKFTSGDPKHDHRNEWKEESDHAVDRNKKPSHGNGKAENEIEDEETHAKQHSDIHFKNKKTSSTEKKHRIYKTISEEITHPNDENIRSSNENKTHRHKKITKLKENNAVSRSTSNLSRERSRQKSRHNDSERSSSNERKYKWQEDLDTNSIDKYGSLDYEDRKTTSKERKWDDDKDIAYIRSENHHQRKRRNDNRGNYDIMHYESMMNSPEDNRNDDFNSHLFNHEFAGLRDEFGRRPKDLRNEVDVPFGENNRLDDYKRSENDYKRAPKERHVDEARRHDARAHEDTRHPKENANSEQHQYNEIEHEQDSSPVHSVETQGIELPQLTDEPMRLSTQEPKMFHLFHNKFLGRIRERISAQIKKLLG